MLNDLVAILLSATLLLTVVAALLARKVSVSLILLILVTVFAASMVSVTSLLSGESE